MSRQDRPLGKPGEVLFRDDQIDPLHLTDEIRFLRGKGRRAALIDSGVYGMTELGWLAEEKLTLYTSDGAGRPGPDLIRIGEDLRRSGGRSIYFQSGSWEGEEGGLPPAFADLIGMGRSGWDIHISNRERERDPIRLSELGRACREGRGLLVYYHAGPLGPWLEDLAGSGAWVHLSEAGLSDDGDVLRVKDAAATARREKSGLILHAPSVRNIAWVRDIFKAGVLVFLETPPAITALPSASSKTR